MNNKDFRVIPLPGESPSEYADRLGIYYSSTVSYVHKKEAGQFFTPHEIASFMASFYSGNLERKQIKILDPGCGVGILSTAIIEEVINSNQTIKTIELVVFETDIHILDLTEKCLEYLRVWLSDRNVDLKLFICKNDFILHNSLALNNQEHVEEDYDIVISNPPYFKLPNDDERAIAARPVIHGQTNIYSIFLLIAAKLLKEDGQLIFITPRSFCSGSYFRIFRELFFSVIDLKAIHLFNSRKAAFKKDKVLQENIIVSANKKKQHEKSQEAPFHLSNSNKVTISSSLGVTDINQRRIKKYDYSSLINFDSYQKILHLPSSDTDEKVISIFKTWTGSLNQYNLEISTGPVVDFRSEEMIKFKKTKNTVPLIWLHNVECMNFKWPNNKGYKGKPKGQYMTNDKGSASRLVENKNYVLLRRFSTKDDNRRLIATPYYKADLSDVPKLGIENHLNYIYHKMTELTKEETTGLAAILNSKLFDLYFRTFNGNINVSATELRDFPLPSFELIKSLGKKIIARNKQKAFYDIDVLVSQTFQLSNDLFKTYGQ